MDIFHLFCFLMNYECKCNTFFQKKRFPQKKNAFNFIGK